MGNIFFAHGHFSGHGPRKKSHGPNYFPMAKKKNGKTVAMAQINSLRHKIHRLSRKEKKKDIKLTLVISKLKGPSETLREIRTSTYQICRIEENTNRTTNIHK